mmetsp:Transcript_49840/g.108805  ORF Transcript_49840/g.108805 Transcript_49840/m.108805 type:complete len:306 (+) Transcript_49840:897-1814(+)
MKTLERHGDGFCRAFCSLSNTEGQLDNLERLLIRDVTAFRGTILASACHSPAAIIVDCKLIKLLSHFLQPLSPFLFSLLHSLLHLTLSLALQNSVGDQMLLFNKYLIRNLLLISRHCTEHLRCFVIRDCKTLGLTKRSQLSNTPRSTLFHVMLVKCSALLGFMLPSSLLNFVCFLPLSLLKIRLTDGLRESCNQVLEGLERVCVRVITASHCAQDLAYAIFMNHATPSHAKSLDFCHVPLAVPVCIVLSKSLSILLLLLSGQQLIIGATSFRSSRSDLQVSSAQTLTDLAKIGNYILGASFHLVV